MNNLLNNNRFKVLIAGAGAVGMALGAFLKRNGFDVTMLIREAHYNAIIENGLKIDGIWGGFIVSDIKIFKSVENLQEMYDFVFVTVKSYDTENMVNSILPYIKEDSALISFQNGIGNMENIAKIAGAQRTAGARVIFGAEVILPGSVKITVCADSVKIGAFLKVKYEKFENKLRTISSALNDSGVLCDFTENVQSHLWAKLLYNSALNPLGAILNVSYGELTEKEESRKVMEDIIHEIFEITAVMGEKLMWDSPNKYLETFYEKLVPATYEHHSSMLYDIKRGRQTEIDSINGKICYFARKFGLSTPVNDTICNIIKSFN